MNPILAAVLLLVPALVLPHPGLLARDLYTGTVETVVEETCSLGVRGPDPCPTWVTYYDGPSGGVDEFYDMAISGEVVLTMGLSTRSGAPEWPVMRTLAVSASTGEVLWDREHVPDGLLGSWPAGLELSTNGETVFVAGFGLGFDDTWAIVAYTVATGDEVWSATVNKGVHKDWLETIAVDQGGERLYLAGTHGNPVDHASVVAFDTTTGKELWSFPIDLDDDARETIGDLVTIDGDVFVAIRVGTESRILGLNGDDGEELWTRSHLADPGVAIWRLLTDGSQLLAFGGTFDTPQRAFTAALDPGDGSSVWDAWGAAEFRAWHAAVLPNKAKVVVTGHRIQDDTSVLRTTARELATGETLWVHEVEDRNSGWGRRVVPSTEGDCLIVIGEAHGEEDLGPVRMETSGDLIIRVLDPATGTTLRAIDQDVLFGMEIAGGGVLTPQGDRLVAIGYTRPLVGSIDGVLAAYDGLCGGEA